METFALRYESKGTTASEVPYRGTRLLRHPMYTKGTAFNAQERKDFGLEGLLPNAVSTMEQQEHRVYANISRKTGPAREVHRPGGAAGPERAPLLPAPGRPRRGVPAHRLYAHGRPGVPGVQPHLPAGPRALDHARAPRADLRDPRQRSVRRRPPHRRDGQRAHPRSRRPGCGRHGDSDRQARALHGGRGHPPVAHASHQSRRRHGQRIAPEGRALPRLAASAPARPRVRLAGRGIRPGREEALPEGAPAMGGLQEGQRLPPAGSLSEGHPLLQRRHPGNRRHGRGRNHGRLPGDGNSSQGPARRHPGSRCRRRRHRPAAARHVPARGPRGREPDSRHREPRQQGSRRGRRGDQGRPQAGLRMAGGSRGEDGPQEGLVAGSPGRRPRGEAHGPDRHVRRAGYVHGSGRARDGEARRTPRHLPDVEPDEQDRREARGSRGLDERTRAHRHRKPVRPGALSGPLDHDQPGKQLLHLPRRRPRGPRGRGEGGHRRDVRRGRPAARRRGERVGSRFRMPLPVHSRDPADQRANRRGVSWPRRETRASGGRSPTRRSRRPSPP